MAKTGRLVQPAAADAQDDGSAGQGGLAVVVDWVSKPCFACVTWSLCISEFACLLSALYPLLVEGRRLWSRQAARPCQQPGDPCNVNPQHFWTTHSLCSLSPSTYSAAAHIPCVRPTLPEALQTPRAPHPPWHRPHSGALPQLRILPRRAPPR